MSMWHAGEILDEATREIPEAILDDEKVQKALQYLFDAVEELTDWIDPNSERWEQEISDAEESGAVAVAEHFESMLEEALYRQKLFGTQFDLERFIESVKAVEIREVVHG